MESPLHTRRWRKTVPAVGMNAPRAMRGCRFYPARPASPAGTCDYVRRHACAAAAAMANSATKTTLRLGGGVGAMVSTGGENHFDSKASFFWA